MLKKVYFEDYRFSEDLDFTLSDPAISNEQIFAWFQEAFTYIKETANIPLSLQENQQHQDGGLNFYIQFVGPLGGLGSNKTVKIDISRAEQLAFAPVQQPAIITYTDLDEHTLRCYTFEEILVEKLRAPSTIQSTLEVILKRSNSGPPRVRKSSPRSAEAPEENAALDSALPSFPKN